MPRLPFIVPDGLVPENAPPDDLADYLRLYSRAAQGFVSGQTSPAHGEWDINLPIPRMRNLRGLDGLFGIGDPIGTPLSLSFPSTGVAQVPTTWAQRAINAAYASIGAATRVMVDGIAGPQTLNALKDLRLRYIARLPTPTPTSPRVVSMPTIVNRDAVTMPGDLYREFTTLTQVADPVRPPSPAESPPAPTPSAGSSSFPFLVAVGLGVAVAYYSRTR